jgi:hypothetical protein
MPIKNEAQWKAWSAASDAPISKYCHRAARKVMELLDAQVTPALISTEYLFSEARWALTLEGCAEGVEWKPEDDFMNAVITTMVTVCHSRGEEFRKSRQNYLDCQEWGDRDNDFGEDSVSIGPMSEA